MIRFAFFLLMVLAAGLALAWFADRPGEVALSWQGVRYETSLLVVVAAFGALLATILATWSAISALLRSPQIMRRFFANRRRDRGYRALGEGLVAAGAGDAARARRMARDARKLLGGETLVEVLNAQTLLLEDNREAARQRFQAMAEEAPTRLLGLRGLYLEAEREGNEEAGRHYAEEAAKSSPALPWANEALLRHLADDGDFEGALGALEKLRSSGAMARADAERKRAVLLTGQGMRSLGGDPDKAAALTKQALKLAPGLVAASLVAAEAQRRGGDIRRAARTLEAAWKTAPHPQIAAAYVGIDEAGTAGERLKRAARLEAMTPANNEARLAMAEAALSAREFATAREALEAAIAAGASRRAYLLMAEIEDGESGDRGRSRDWLVRAMRADPDPAWIADGVVSEHWLPVSPTSGRIDAFEWKTPSASPGRLPALPTMPPADEADIADVPAGGAAIAAAASPKESVSGEGTEFGRQPDDPGEAIGAPVEKKKGFGLF
jgi:HemY protein